MDTGLIHNAGLAHSPSPWNESLGQGLHKSQLMVIPIPQYKDFATISSLKELNLSDCRFLQRFYRFDPWPGCQKIGNDQFKIV
jgi:hypothetical protein